MKSLVHRVLSVFSALLASSELKQLTDAGVDGLQATVSSKYAVDAARALRILFSASWRCVRDGLVAFKAAGGFEAWEKYEALERKLMSGLKPTAEEKIEMMAWVGSLQLERFQREGKRWKEELERFKRFVDGKEVMPADPSVESDLQSETESADRVVN